MGMVQRIKCCRLRLTELAIRLGDIIEMVHIYCSSARAYCLHVANEAWASGDCSPRPDIVRGLRRNDWNGAFGLERCYGILDVEGKRVDHDGRAATTGQVKFSLFC